MSQSKSAAMYVCRSCRHALQYTNVHTPASTRAFSSTRGRSKALASFHETSSSDLNALLSTWRQKVFLPSTLSPHHQALIYKTTRHDILLNAPGVTVTLPIRPSSGSSSDPTTESGQKEEDIQLLPQDRFDRPHFKKSLAQYAELLEKHAGDVTVWETLPVFLEGLKQARYEVPMYALRRIVRKAWMAEPNRLGLVLRCAERGEMTGVKLSWKELVREMLVGLHWRAFGWKGAEVDVGGQQKKALERLVILLEKEMHCGSLTKTDIENGEVDMRKDPLVMAVMLEFAAARAAKSDDKQDTTGEVAMLAQKLLARSEELAAEGKPMVSYDMEGTTQAHVYEEAVIMLKALEMALAIDMVSTLGKEKDLSLRLKLQRLHQNIERAGKPIYDEVAASGKGRVLVLLKDTNAAMQSLGITPSAGQ